MRYRLRQGKSCWPSHVFLRPATQRRGPAEQLPLYHIKNDLNRKDMPPLAVGAYRIMYGGHTACRLNALAAGMSGDVVLLLEVEVYRVAGADCDDSGHYALSGSPHEGGNQQDCGGNNRQKSHQPPAGHLVGRIVVRHFAELEHGDKGHNAAQQADHGEIA